MSKENVANQALAQMEMLRKYERKDVQIAATIMVAQAVDRLTALLTPVVAEITAEIARAKAERP